MEKLLENHDKRKLDILFKLSLDFTTKNINELAQELDTNTRTLLASIEEIGQDIIRFEQKARIERISKSEVIFDGKVGFSIFEFKFKYIQESILYQILDSSFKHTYENIQETADAYHISTASLYRKITSLKKILEAFDLNFESQSRLLIKGNEKQIRFFFFHFYWYTYKHLEWPFDQQLKELCTVIYEDVFEKHFLIKTHIIKEKIILLLAINIKRNLDGHPLKEEDVIEMIQILNHNSEYESLKERISQTPHQLGDETYALIYCMIMCDEDYTEEMEFNFLAVIARIGENKVPYEETTFLMLQSVSRFIQRPLTNTEFYEIFHKILKINMRAYLFVEKEEFFKSDLRLDYAEKHYAHYEPYFKKFYQELMKRGRHFHFLKDTPHLYSRYLLVLISHIEAQTLHPQIKIAFLLEKSPITKRYKKKIKSFVISPIQFTADVTPDTDLVITSTSFGLESGINYFILTVPATSWELGLLEIELNEIEQSKMGLNKDKKFRS